MLFFNLSQFRDNPAALVAYLIAIVATFMTGLAFHEFSHAWTAYELGDNTAQRQGRLTLNPVRHIDPMGAVLLLLVGFGWAKPTPFNPARLSVGPLGSVLVAAAGPVSNFVIAALAALPPLGWIHSIASFDNIRDASGQEIVGLGLAFVAVINVFLGVFNLIPIHPLDGFKVAVGVLPRELSQPLAALAPWGPGILMTLFVISWVAPQYNVLGWIIGGLGGHIYNLIT